MKRILLPSLCAALLVGCDGDDPKALLADKLDGSAAKVASPTNSVGTELAVEPPKTPPALPEPVRDVLRLAQTSVSEGVLVDFIGTIRETFNLSADQIIYLTDLGLSGPTIQALLKHTPAGGATADAPAVAATPAPVPNTATPLPSTPGVAPQSVMATGAPAPGPAPSQVVIAAPSTEVNYNTFYDSLSSYGSWVEVPEYGWCWQPSVAAVNPGWQPYADNGGWIWSDVGWYWNSYYSWGWAPFHYGRWHRAGFGWCWVPDVQWAPAWVTWRSSDAYCGWAPLPPGARWTVGVGLTWNGRHAAADCAFGLYANSFVYLGWNRFCDPRPWNHYVPRNDVPHIYAETKIINDFHERGAVRGPGKPGPAIVNNGPGVAPAQAHVPGGVPEVHLSSTPRVPTAGAVGFANRGTQIPAVLPVYRPNLSSGSGAIQPAPTPLAFANRPGAPASSTAFVGPSSAPASTTPGYRLVPRDPDNLRIPAPQPGSAGPIHILDGSTPVPSSAATVASTRLVPDTGVNPRTLVGSGTTPRTTPQPIAGPVIVPARNPNGSRIPPTVYRNDLEGSPSGSLPSPSQAALAARAAANRPILSDNTMTANPAILPTGVGTRPLATPGATVAYSAPTVPVNPTARTVYGQGYSAPAPNYPGTSTTPGSSYSSPSYSAPVQQPSSSFSAPSSVPAAISRGYSAPQPSAPVFSSPPIRNQAPVNNNTSSGGGSANTHSGGNSSNGKHNQ